jgi:hypothetical protein
MRRAAVLTAFLLAAGFATGCTKQQTTTSRSQVDDDFSEKLQKATVGDKTVVSNTEPIPVSGVGLVWKLPGTGSVAKAPWREFLEKSLRQKKLNPRDFLDDPSKQCSLVLVNAVIPAGARKGDLLDIEVSLPPGSETTSLKGGVLFECELFPYDRAGNVRERMVQAGADLSKNPVVSGDTLLLGQPLVRAAGPIVAGMDGTEKPGDTPGYRVGRIWGGGRFLEDRPYWFAVSDDNEKSARLMGTIAARLNEAFPAVGSDRTKTANAINNRVTLVQVPPAYRLNHGRFLLVARQVTMVPMRPGDPRREKLAEELLEPATAIPAAIKLEAIGPEVQAELRVGLESRSPWVRFAAAESLAYLGSTAGVDELARLAENHPGIRSHCLTALATLDDGISADRLTELMAHPDPQLRYGAFVALRSANPHHSALNPKNIKGTFSLHHVVPDSPGLIHVVSTRRSEVVLFGNVGELRGAVSFPIGSEFTVTMDEGDETVTVSKIIVGKDGAEALTVKVRPTVGAVLSALGELGGGYSEAVEFLRRADAARALPVALAVDAAPRGIPLPQLAVMARSDPDLETANLEVARASRGDIQQASYDLPTEADSVRAPVASVPAEIPLNQNPGRLFGPKKHPLEVRPEPAPKAIRPTAPANPPADLARNPGKLFRK